MPYIYKITNDINEKIYIGKTERTIEERWKEHCKDYLYRGKNRPLYNAMKKYGIEHFHIELVEETDKPIEREIYWIEYYNTYKKGYNATLGGDGRSFINYQLVIENYNDIGCIKDVAEKLNISTDAVSYILKQYNIPIKSGKEVTGEKRAKKVGMYDKNTGELVAVFDSISKGADYLINKGYVNGSHKSVASHISDTCRGKRKTVGQFKWNFI